MRIYDENVALARLLGANKDYIETQIPHISSLMSDDRDGVIDHADVIIIGNGDEEFREVLQRKKPMQTVIDLVRISDETSELPGYQGIAW